MTFFDDFIDFFEILLKMTHTFLKCPKLRFFKLILKIFGLNFATNIFENTIFLITTRAFDYCIFLYMRGPNQNKNSKIISSTRYDNSYANKASFYKSTLEFLNRYNEF